MRMQISGSATGEPSQPSEAVAAREHESALHQEADSGALMPTFCIEVGEPSPTFPFQAGRSPAAMRARRFCQLRRHAFLDERMVPGIHRCVSGCTSYPDAFDRTGAH